MARHSDGKQNWSLTPAALGVVVLVIILLISGVWAAYRALSPSEQCGTIKVGLADPSLHDELSSPLSDSCIEITSVPTEDADAYFGPDTPDTERVLDVDSRTSQSQEVVSVFAVGIEGDSTVDPASLTPHEISFPLTTAPVAAATAATALGFTPEDLQQRENAEYSVVREDEASDEFSVIEGAGITYSLHSLDGSNQSLVQQAAEIIKNAHDTPDQTTTIDPAIWEYVDSPEAFQTEEQPTPDATPNNEAAEAKHTLFLLDTSNGMINDYPLAAEMIAEQAAEQTSDGGSVALWNYSSPLNEGVTRGWRRNVAFTEDASQVADSANRFGIGGQPLTRSAVLAALEYAAQYATETGDIVEVKLITSGTSENDLTDEQFREALSNLDTENVVLNVEQLGDGHRDELLGEI